jgi:hypothetical protein
VKRLANVLASHERHLQALELRKAGASYRTIAEQLGYRGVSGAFKAVTSALKATLKEPAEELRTLELERLDAMLLPLWRRVQNGDEKAVDRVLRIAERRAKLLGLDAPTRRELSGPDGGPIESEVTYEDLSRLSDAELSALEQMHAKLAAE